MYHSLLLGFLSILGDKDDIQTVYGCLLNGNRIISHSLSAFIVQGENHKNSEEAY